MEYFASALKNRSRVGFNSNSQKPIVNRFKIRTLLNAEKLAYSVKNK